VYAVENVDRLAVKMFHEDRKASRVERVTKMLDAPCPKMLFGEEENHYYLAWPSSLVTDEFGTEVGFSMPRLDDRYQSWACSSPAGRCSTSGAWTGSASSSSHTTSHT
jgi:hypothetical protein